MTLEEIISIENTDDFRFTSISGESENDLFKVMGNIFPNNISHLKEAMDSPNKIINGDKKVFIFLVATKDDQTEIEKVARIMLDRKYQRMVIFSSTVGPNKVSFIAHSKYTIRSTVDEKNQCLISSSIMKIDKLNQVQLEDIK